MVIRYLRVITRPKVIKIIASGLNPVITCRRPFVLARLLHGASKPSYRAVVRLAGLSLFLALFLRDAPFLPLLCHYFSLCAFHNHPDRDLKAQPHSLEFSLLNPSSHKLGLTTYATPLLRLGYSVSTSVHVPQGHEADLETRR